MDKLKKFLMEEMHYDEDLAQSIIDNDEYACMGTPETYGQYLFENEIAIALDSYWETTLRSVIDFYDLGIADLNDINRFLIDGEIYEIYNF